MAKTHYETFGLKRTATPAEIKSAYRKIVLAHHPDRSKNAGSPAIFLAATAAYDVLSDPAARLRYDEAYAAELKRAAARERPDAASGPRPTSGPRPGWTEPRRDTASVTSDVQRLTSLFARGRHAEAEKLAREIILVAPKNPIVYAVLGDIARQRGNKNEAAKMYAYAAQFEPNNAVYQRRYEELLSNSRVVEDRRQTTQLESEDQKILAPMAGSVIVLAAGAYVFFSPEAAAFSKIAMINSWTVGLPIMLFLSGIGVGASLAMGNLLDRFQSMTTTATGRVGPAVALGLVAAVNFWAAAFLYLMLGAFQRAFNFSTSRIILGVATTLFVLSLAATHGPARFGQVFLWGGNIVYFGALAGWLVTDSFRA